MFSESRVIKRSVGEKKGGMMVDYYRREEQEIGGTKPRNS